MIFFYLNDLFSVTFNILKTRLNNYYKLKIYCRQIFTIVTSHRDKHVMTALIRKSEHGRIFVCDETKANISFIKTSHYLFCDVNLSYDVW